VLLGRFLRRLLRRPTAAPGFGPLPAREDAEGWLVEPVAPGVTRHRPPPVPVQRDVDPLTPLGRQHPPRLPRRSEVIRAAARRRSHDGTWG
jgi:hypothetical protein